jgi:GntR family transcriptional regulator
MYAQLAALLRRRIETGEWAPGQKLPTLEAIEAEYQVARVTARSAIGLLEEEGLVWRKQGKGTFVARGLSDRRWLSLAADWSSLMQMIAGTRMRALLVERVARPPRLAPEDAPLAPAYQHLRRVHVKDDTPYCVIDLYVAADLYARAPRAFQSQLALRVLSDMKGVRIAAAHQTLTIGRAGAVTAELLEVEVDAPVAEVQRVIRGADGRVIYYAEIIYRGDFVKLDIDLLGNRATNK